MGNDTENGPAFDPNWCQLITNHPDGGSIPVCQWDVKPQLIQEAVERGRDALFERGDECGEQLLPGWITDRMMHDVWSFGLLLKGEPPLVVAIQTLEKIYEDGQGNHWCDVRLIADNGEIQYLQEALSKWLPGARLVGAPTGRELGTLRMDQIVFGFELADS